MKNTWIVTVWVGMILSTLITVFTLAAGNPPTMVAIFFVALWAIVVNRGIAILNDLDGP
jgi:hypothetical protein